MDVGDESARIDVSQRIAIRDCLACRISCHNAGNSQGNPFHKYSWSLKAAAIEGPPSSTRWRGRDFAVARQKVGSLIFFARE